MRAVLFITILSFFSVLRAQATGDEVSSLYRDIGKELITIRKDNPGLQTTVYSLLDQVGKLYRAANTALQEKERAVQIAHEDREATFLLRGENEKLKGDLTKLQGDLQSKTVEVANAQQQMTALSREQEVLRHAASEGEAKQAEFENRVKALEGLKPQAQGKAPQPPAHASLEGEQAQAAMREFAAEVETSEA